MIVYRTGERDANPSDLLGRLRQTHSAIDLLVDFQRSPASEINPPFTSGFFLAEMEMTREYYVEKLMGVEYSQRLEPFFRKLAENLTEHPYVLCHRDFHDGGNHHPGSAHVAVHVQRQGS